MIGARSGRRVENFTRVETFGELDNHWLRVTVRRVEVSETELPKGGSGKILKRTLRERFWARQERAVS
jgi:acyl-coenzyme A synthetase/AMP-(fatty) acid ligase